MLVPVAELVDHLGESRPLKVTVERAQVDEHDSEWGPAQDTLQDPLELDLVLESVSEGVLVRGTVEMNFEIECARCLVPQQISLAQDVAELFNRPTAGEESIEDQDGYWIADDLASLDLGPMLRDTVVVAVPVRVLCRKDCQGLCPQCGADRNLGECCGWVEDTTDPRWAALAEIQIDPN